MYVIHIFLTKVYGKLPETHGYIGIGKRTAQANYAYTQHMPTLIQQPPPLGDGVDVWEGGNHNALYSQTACVYKHYYW